MRTLLATLLVTAALGKRAGNTLMPRAEDDRTASLMQYTDRHPPAAEAVRSAATTALRATYTKAAETELFDAEDCTRVMGPNGLCACCNTWTLAQLSSLYTHGQPDNALPSVGLTVHGFDGTLQGGGGASVSLMSGAAYESRGMLPWLPCDSGWCANASRWLSTSVINAAHRAGFSDGGIILKPGATQVLCSHYRDFESLRDDLCSWLHSSEVPALPRKGFWRSLDGAFLERRRAHLEAWLQSLLERGCRAGGRVFGMGGPGAVIEDFLGLNGVRLKMQSKGKAPS